MYVARSRAGSRRSAPAKRITAASLQKYRPPRIPGPLITEGRGRAGARHRVDEVGGDVLPVEVTLMPGKGTLTLTGQLGDIMRRARRRRLAIPAPARTTSAHRPDVSKTPIASTCPKARCR